MGNRKAEGMNSTNLKRLEVNQGKVKVGLGERQDPGERFPFSREGVLSKTCRKGEGRFSLYHSVAGWLLLVPNFSVPQFPLLYV